MRAGMIIVLALQGALLLGGADQTDGRGCGATLGILPAILAVAERIRCYPVDTSIIGRCGTAHPNIPTSCAASTRGSARAPATAARGDQRRDIPSKNVVRAPRPWNAAPTRAELVSIESACRFPAVPSRAAPQLAPAAYRSPGPAEEAGRST